MIQKRFYEASTASSNDVNVLPIKRHGRPVSFGEDLDRVVRDYIQNQRRKGAVITRLTVTAIGGAIVMKHNKSMLSEFGGGITVTMKWALHCTHSGNRLLFPF